MNGLEKLLIRKKVESVADNEIKESSMSPQTKSWAVGAANAIISGAAASLGSLVAGISVKQGAVIVVTSMVVSFLKWSYQHPIPDPTTGGK